MQPGTKVRALRCQGTNPRIRGRAGEVKGPGPSGTVAVLFDGDAATVNVDPAVLEQTYEAAADVGTE